MFDCIIVGAGPAGGASAYHLAKQGHTVLVLEKDSLPRYKACSGGVAPCVAQWFDFDFSPAISRTVDQVRYTWKLGDPIEAELVTSEPMWMVQREVFDQFLIDQAKAQGAEVRDQTTVTGIEFKGDRWQVNTTGEAVEAKYVIAADGALGPMAHWLGFPEKSVRMAEVMEFTTESSSRVFFDLGIVKNGNLWAFPKATGYSIAATTFRGGEPQDFAKPIAEFAQEKGWTGGTLHRHAIAFWHGNQPLHTQNAVVVGEAAALVDPLSAEGIRPALFSGVKAATAIHQALGGDSQALSTYTDTIHNEWGTDMQVAQRIAGMFYRVPGMAYKVGLKRPAATKRLGQLLTGESSYAELANKITKRLGLPTFGRS